MCHSTPDFSGGIPHIVFKCQHKRYVERGEICSQSFGEFTFLATELKLCLQKIPALFYLFIIISFLSMETFW